MKKIIILLVSIILITYLPVSAQDFSGKKEALKSAEPERRLIEGEKLVYSVEWIGIPVGNITLTIDGIKKVNGFECYDISAIAKTNQFFSRFHDIEYTVHTYVDKNSFSTRRFEKTRRLGKKITKTAIDFDWEKMKADFKEKGDAPFFGISGERANIPLGEQTNEVLAGTQDLFSSLYYLRLFDLVEGKSYSINIYYGGKNWPLTVAVGRPFSKEIRKKGVFVCLKAEIYSQLNKFILGKGRMIVYFTADSRRIPIEFKFGTGIGTVQGKIKSIPK